MSVAFRIAILASFLALSVINKPVVAFAQAKVPVQAEKNLVAKAETVALIVESSFFAQGAVGEERLLQLARILVRQPGAKRMVAYAVGSGDSREIWTGEKQVGPADESVVREGLATFVHRTAGNPGTSLSRILERIALALDEHANQVEARFRKASTITLPQSTYRLRVLVAAETIDPVFRLQAPETTCADGDFADWPEGKLRPRTIRLFGGVVQEVLAFWVYDAVAAGSIDRPLQLNRAVETFLHAGFLRDGISFGGVYYLQRSTEKPLPPRVQVERNSRPCSHLTDLGEAEKLDLGMASEPSPLPVASPQTDPSGPSTPPTVATATPPPLIPIPAPPRPSSGRHECADPAGKQAVIDAYIVGNADPAAENDLSAQWEEVSCAVLRVVANPGRTPAERARAVELVRKATQGLIPKGVQGDFGRPLPYLEPQHYEVIYELAQAADATVRKAAVQFVKAFPVDAFELRFRGDLGTAATKDLAARERLAEAAVDLYYNRIVALLPGSDADEPEPSHRAIIGQTLEVELSRGLSWTSDKFFPGSNGKVYEAMLQYAAGLVECLQRLEPDLGRN